MNGAKIKEGRDVHGITRLANFFVQHVSCEGHLSEGRQAAATVCHRNE
jgi:hypothetical protein